MKKRLFALLCSFLFLAAGCISAFAAQDVPADVLNAIDSVIRVRATTRTTPTAPAPVSSCSTMTAAH